MKLDKVGDLMEWNKLGYDTSSKKNNPKMENWPENVKIDKRKIVPHEDESCLDKWKGVNVLGIEECPFNLSIALDRGMEPNALRYGSDSISWETPIGQLLHPDDVNLAKAGRILNAQIRPGAGWARHKNGMYDLSGKSYQQTEGGIFDPFPIFKKDVGKLIKVK